MGPLIYFYAGADANNLPTSPIDSLLINVLDHGSTPAKIKAAKKMLRKANARYSMGDSSGIQIHKGREKGQGDNVRSKPSVEKYSQGIEHIAAAGHGGERYTSARYRHWA